MRRRDAYQVLAGAAIYSLALHSLAALVRSQASRQWKLAHDLAVVLALACQYFRANSVQRTFASHRLQGNSYPTLVV
jgi:hypothetical protein